jgi:hypothetical protein
MTRTLLLATAGLITALTLALAEPAIDFSKRDVMTGAVTALVVNDDMCSVKLPPGMLVKITRFAQRYGHRIDDVFLEEVAGKANLLLESKDRDVRNLMCDYAMALSKLM